MEVNLPETSTKVIEISALKKYSFFSNLMAILIILLFPATVSFGIGYLVGKYQAVNSDNLVLTKNQKTLPVEKGQTAYSDTQLHYKVSYPDGWKATKKESGVPGVILETGTASVEIWLSVQQPVTLNAEQKAGVEKTNTRDILVNKRKLKLTEHLYKAGNYFSAVELPADSSSPQVTFWIKAFDKASYEQSLIIVESFSF